MEEFFEGNNDWGSIGYNFYPDQPAPSEFYAFFKNIRSRPEVVDVLVEVVLHEVPEEWPSTDTIWIITSAATDDVKEWLGKRFQADDIVEGWSEEQGFEVESYKVPDGMHPVGVWWD